ncbi:MAG: DUF362 domain-containing protein [candidate division WOR-3 bacterium]|nr:DUF362 domain-containing protein [candidate division WOR-3 bacterium]
MNRISRREFLKYLGSGALGLAFNPKLGRSSEIDGRASDVVQCFHTNATSGSNINEPVVQIMMDASIMALTRINDVGEAWKSIFPGITSSSVIGIKVNCINSALPSHPAFVNCIVNGLRQMRFSGNPFNPYNIIIWDRTDSELVSCGYTINYNNPGQVRCFGTDHSGVGYDNTCTLTIQTASGTYTRYPSRILSQMIDYLIDVAVLKNHSSSQVTLCLKNHYGSINNPGGLPHASYCNPEIPSMNQQIRDVVTPNNIQKLFIIDALFGNVTSGPGGSPNCNPKKLIMSRDPVACDYRGWQVINIERQGLGQSPIPWPVYHIQTASQSPYNLGTTDINLIEINNPQGLEEIENSQADRLIAVRPNPFRKNGTIEFMLEKDSPVYIDLIDQAGRIVDNIYKGYLLKGRHRIEYVIKKGVPQGNYFVKLYCSGKNYLKKVTIIN